MASTIYKFWRNKVQREIKAAKKHYYENRVADVEQTNPRKWWKHIKSLTGQGIQNEWYIINSSKAQRILSQPLTPAVSSTQIPVELLVTEEVYQSLPSIDTTKAVGPDDIPNKLLKNFSFELAPVNKGYLQPVTERGLCTNSFEIFYCYSYTKDRATKRRGE